VQWLCINPDPAAALRRFYAGLHRALRPGARAALQVYPEGEAILDLHGLVVVFAACYNPVR
jgi:hypothetical protein